MNYLKKAFQEVPQEDKEYVQLSMDLASQIDSYIKANKLNRRKFAVAIGKEESEISKWLSGSHNFTIRTLAKIQTFFGQKLFIVEKDIQSNVQTYILTRFASTYYTKIHSFEWADQKFNFEPNECKINSQSLVAEANFNG